MSKKAKLNTRREFMRAASAAGLGAAVLAYQNCSPVNFEKQSLDLGSGGGQGEPDVPTKIGRCRNPALPYDFPFYGDDDRINDHEVDRNPGGEHSLNMGFWSSFYFNPEDNTSNNLAHLLTVDIGSNPAGNVFHPMPSSMFANANTITDVYVFNDKRFVNDKGEVDGDIDLIRWHRFGAADYQPSVMFVLDPELVQLGAKLKVVTRCAQHGYFEEELDLSAEAAQPYSGAVPTANTAVNFAGTSMFRPYIAQSATGGQAIGIPGHTPSFEVVNNNTVRVAMGAINNAHPVVSDNHYIAGAMLFDQNGQQIGEHQVTSIGFSGPNLVFEFRNCQLAERGVTVLRAVIQDTFNGHLMGFKNL